MPKATTKHKPRFDVEVAGRVVKLRFDVKAADWEQWVLLRADAHRDHPEADRDLERRHLEQALERNAAIFDFGDLFCAMQGMHDRRRDDDKRDDDRGPGYYDRIVDAAARELAPYAGNFVMLGRGNHETAVLRHAETDLTARLAERLGVQAVGGLKGWARYQFEMHGSARTSLTMFWTHGGGGKAPVTRGVIQTNRRAVYLPDADIVVSGHIHEAWTVHVPRARITAGGHEYTDVQTHIQIPSYKSVWHRTLGWEHEKDFAPNLVGAVWLRLWYTTDGHGRRRIAYEPTLAQ